MKRRAPVRLRGLLALASLVVVSSLSACGGAQHPSQQPPGIAELRARAVAHPHDARAQREVAVAELLSPGGDTQRAGPALSHALALAPQDATLLLLRGVDEVMDGHPGEALDALLDSLDSASAGEAGADSPLIAEIAASSADELTEAAPDFVARAKPRLEHLLAHPGHIGIAARERIASTLIELAYQRGDAEAVRGLAQGQGCITQWKVAGPFGPFSLLGFDQHFAPDHPGPLAAQYDLGPGRGVRPTRDVEARGCAVHIGGSGWASSGTTYAQGYATVAAAGDYVVRLETPNAVELRIDGQQVARLDMRSEPTPRITFHRLHLDAGRHEVLVKVTARHPNPILLVAIAPATAVTAEAVGRPRADDDLGGWLAASVAMERGDPITARELLHDVPVHGGSAAMLQLRAVTALSNPIAPGDKKRDDARRYLRAVAGLDANAWYPEVQLAELDAADGHMTQAIARLRRARQKWPNMAPVALASAHLLMAQGWDAEAWEAVEQARHDLPHACSPLAAALSIAKQRDRTNDVADLVGRVVSCDARSDARFSLLVDQRRWDAASHELESPRRPRATPGPGPDPFGEAADR